MHSKTTVQWLRRFNHGHGAALTLIAGFVREHLTPPKQIIIDLPQSNYIYPQHIGGTDSHSDIVVWQDDSKEVNILELNFDAARKWKICQYTEPIKEAKHQG